MAKLRDLGNFYWSSCPDTGLVSSLARRGVKLVVDLTEGECSYELPSGVEKLEYPIPDFSYRAFEGVLVDVVLPVLERIKMGDGVLVHCRGGIGRSGVTVAMLICLRDNLSKEEVLNRMRRLGFMGETPSQTLALRWFFRAQRLTNVQWISKVVKHLKREGVGALRYWTAYGDHASTVAGVALDILEAVEDTFKLNASDLRNAYAAGLLHDVGRVFGEDEQHHETGAVFALNLKEVKECCNLEVVAKAIFHHRRQTDLLGDKSLRELGEAAQLVAAAIRLGDAFENAYKWEGVYIGSEKKGSKLILLLNSDAYNCVNQAYLKAKAEAFTKLTGLKVHVELV
ncbi:MAG: HD domain-containing protein [Thermofilaceae archaeon]